MKVTLYDLNKVGTANTAYYKEWLTDKELVRSYESHEDPVIRRFVRMAIDNGLIEEIPVASNATSISEYIDELKAKISDLEETLSVRDDELAEAEAKADKLSLRTVPQLIEDLAAKLKEEQGTNYRLREEVRKAKEEEDDARSKLDMWAILNRDSKDFK